MIILLKQKIVLKKALSQLKPSTKTRYLKTMAAIKQAQNSNAVRTADVQSSIEALNKDPVLAVTT